MLISRRNALGRALQMQVARMSHRLTRLAERPVFCDAHSLFGPATQRVDLASMRLQRALPERLARDEQRVAHSGERLAQAGPLMIERANGKIGLLASRLDDLSPVAILARGYSAAFKTDGRTVVSKVSQVAIGDALLVRVSDGRIECTVEGVEREGS